MKVHLTMMAGWLLPMTISAQVQFQPAESNPLGISSNPSNWYSCPTFADLDGDGDQDMLSGSANPSGFYYYENIGTIDNPVFTWPGLNPFNLVSGSGESKPCFVDLDNDGDFDMMAGDGGSAFRYFENIGDATNAWFDVVQINPYSLTGVGQLSTPTFVDIDNDGDMDLFSGLYNGSSGIRYFENIGTASAPNFGPVQVNPFSLSLGATETNIEFADLDKDGDFDAMGSYSSVAFYYFENTGTASAPVLGLLKLIPLVYRI